MAKTRKLPPPAPAPDYCIPQSAQWEYAVIDQFLRGALLSVEDTLQQHREQAMYDRTDRLRGLLEYFRHQKSTLEDLIARNHSAHNAKRPRKPR